MEVIDFVNHFCWAYNVLMFIKHQIYLRGRQKKISFFDPCSAFLTQAFWNANGSQSWILYSFTILNEFLNETTMKLSTVPHLHLSLVTENEIQRETKLNAGDPIHWDFFQYSKAKVLVIGLWNFLYFVINEQHRLKVKLIANLRKLSVYYGDYNKDVTNMNFMTKYCAFLD